MLTLLLTLAFAPPSSELPLEPLPPTPPPAQLLELAAEAYAHKDAEGCGKLAQDALQSGELDEAQAAQAWITRGQCFVLGGDVDKAQRAYAAALRVKPDAAVDDDAFRAAKRERQPLTFRAARVPDPPDTVEVELGGDDLLLVKSAILVRAGEELARFPLDAEHAKHRVTGLGDGELTAFLLDKHGNKIAHVALATEPEHVLTPPPASSSSPTILTTLGATAIGAGIVGIVASGIGVASLGDKALDDGQLWLVGVGASTGLFLVGASLVVVDQGLSP